MLATIASASLQGIDAEPVQVEVNANESGQPKLILVGLPDAAVKESDDRVFSALGNSGFETLRTRTTINLAPGHLRKEGPIYDLPIALAFLVATGQLRTASLGDFLIAGELSLSGATRPIRGALAMARLARKLGKRAMILPGISAEEAALVEGVAVHRADTLDRAYRFLAGEIPLEAIDPAGLQPFGDAGPFEAALDFSEVKGQSGLRRAVEVAVAGAHNLLMIGPPGSGKSMVAKRVRTILPSPTLEERLEILSIESAAGRTLSDANSSRGTPPFRAPHHSASNIALLGGGTLPGPGEISLAHHGVLFLDELPEFKRGVLEVLRQPLEDGQVTLSRSAGKVTLPCSFMLIAAMNPCPCGHLGDPKRRCRCTPTQIQNYRARVSGPLLDRIDLHVEAPALSVAELRTAAPGEPSAEIRARVLAARERQAARFGKSKSNVNARMAQGQIRKHCALDSHLGDLLQEAMEKLRLSARAYDRILKVARTIADLAGMESIAAPHLLEAIQYRSLDRDLFY
jgi:magnesium chelatase family protein